MADKQKLADQIRSNAEMAKEGEKKRKGGKTGFPNQPVQVHMGHRFVTVASVTVQSH